MNRSVRYAGIILCLGFVLILCQSCSISSNLSDLIPGELPEIGKSGREAMAFVVDPDYNPIPNALIGANNQYTDSNGVYFGELTALGSGWVPVQAPGYVTNYAKPSPFSGEVDLYFVTLAPVGEGYHYEEETGVKVLQGKGDDSPLEVQLAPGALTDKNGLVEVTVIDPRQISMDDAWAELDNAYESTISFDISALNMEGDAVNLAESKTAQLLIRDSNHDVNQMVLKSFDPESGTWNTQKDACSRLDDDTIQCSLTHFSMHTFLEGNLEGWQLETEAIDDFRILFYTIGKIYKEGEKDGTLTEEAADTVSYLLEKLVEIAKDFAKKNPNETGKAMLVYTTQLALSSGVEGGQAIANELIKLAQDLTAEMAKKLIDKADCGHTDEIMHLVQQGQLLGGSANQAANDLINKVKDQLDNCVIWTGEIHYMFFLLDIFPDLEDNWILQSTGKTWFEIHQVRIGINPLTGHLSGTSKVRLNMNDASYLAEIGGGDCGPDKHYLDVEAKPGAGFTTLEFEGTYDGNTWSIGPLQEKDYEPVILFMHQHGLFGCPKQEMELSNTQMFTYRSQLLHGFMGTPEPPSLEEMLNNGDYRAFDDFEFIRGSQDLYYSSEVNRPPIIPVDHGFVVWTFRRVSSTTME